MALSIAAGPMAAAAAACPITVGARTASVAVQVAPSRKRPKVSGATSHSRPHSRPRPATATERPVAAVVHSLVVIVRARRANSGTVKLKPATARIVVGPSRTCTARSAPMASSEPTAATSSSALLRALQHGELRD